MSHKIFINLPVSDLAASTAFYEAIGWVKNPEFSNENASGLALSDIHLMILARPFFEGFLEGKKSISDSLKTCEVMNAISFESREAVDVFMMKALTAGATEFRTAQDHGFMYARAIADLDGHIWEAFWMEGQK